MFSLLFDDTPTGVFRAVFEVHCANAGGIESSTTDTPSASRKPGSIRGVFIVLVPLRGSTAVTWASPYYLWRDMVCGGPAIILAFSPRVNAPSTFTRDNCAVVPRADGTTSYVTDSNSEYARGGRDVIPRPKITTFAVSTPVLPCTMTWERFHAELLPMSPPRETVRSRRASLEITCS